MSCNQKDRGEHYLCSSTVLILASFIKCFQAYWSKITWKRNAIIAWLIQSLLFSHHNHRNRSVVQPQCLKAHQPTDEVPPKHRSEGLGALLDSLASHQNGSGSARTETFFNFQLSKSFPVQAFIYFLCWKGKKGEKIKVGNFHVAHKGFLFLIRLQ